MNRKDEMRVRRQFKLTPGRDDDLIEWLSRIPKGEREPTILAALRTYMTGNEGNRIARMERQIELMQRTLNSLPELLSRVAVVQTPSNGHSAPGLTEDAARERAARMKKAKW